MAETNKGVAVNTMSKLQFLQQENNQMKNQIADLQNMLTIHREALSKSIKSLKSNTKTEAFLKTLYEENEQLLDIIERLTLERNEAECKALLNEQICDESLKQVHEYAINLETGIRQKILDLNNSSQYLENNFVSDDNNCVIRYREFHCVREEILRIQKASDEAIHYLSIYKRKNEEMRGELESMKIINYNLASELTKFKSSQSPNLTFKTTSQTYDFKHSFSEDSSPEEEKYEDKVDLTISAQKLPKLDLAKAKKIQEINAKRQSQNDKSNLDPTKLRDKIKRQETEMESVKNLLQCEMIENRRLAMDLVSLKSQNGNLESQNEIFSEAFLDLEGKWKETLKELQLYKSFYMQFADLVKLRKGFKTFSILPANRTDPIIKRLKREGVFKGENIQEEEEEDSLDPPLISSKGSYKMHILDLAKDVSLHYKEASKKKKPSHRPSSSSVVDYFSQIVSKGPVQSESHFN